MIFCLLESEGARGREGGREGARGRKGARGGREGGRERREGEGEAREVGRELSTILKTGAEASQDNLGSQAEGDRIGMW